MSKCWYCNNELTSGDSPKHFGICNKCYDEMFKISDTIIRSFTNKIAELQKQLEETEEERDGNYENYSICWKDNEYLKQQLKEKDKKIEQLKKFDDLNRNFFALFRTAFKEPDKVDDLFNTLKTIQEKQHQDKISFAVEQIIKTKETLIKFLQNDGFYENEWYDLFDEIDNQFKQLKEKNNENIMR